MKCLTNILIWCIFLNFHLWKLTESIERCKHYSNPRNGRVVCDSLFRLFCTPECDDGFMFEFKPAVVYMCGPLTGEWFTYPEGEKVPWPDCITKESSKVHAMEDEMTSRRAQITQKIHDTHPNIFSQNYQLQPIRPAQPDTRYLHLFSYIQRAQQVYNNKQMGNLGFNALEHRRQLKLQQQLQQKQRQLEIQRQLQRRRKILQQQNSIQQTHNCQQMIQKQRQQRQAIDSPITNRQQNVQTRFWRGTAYHNEKGNSQMNSGAISQPASPEHTLFIYHPKVPQISYERHSPYVALQRNYAGKNVATPLFHHGNPQLNSHSMISPKLTGFVQSSQYQSQVKESNKMPAKQAEPPVSVSQATTHLWQQRNPALNSHFNVSSKQSGFMQSSQSQSQVEEKNNMPARPQGSLVSVPQLATLLWNQSNPAFKPHSMASSKQTGFVQSLQSQSQVVKKNNMPVRPQEPLVSVSGSVMPSSQRSYLSSDQGVEKLQTNVNSQPRQNNPDAIRVISQPSNQISSTSTNINHTYQSGIVPSKANMSRFKNPLLSHLQAENELNAPLKTELPPIMSTKTAEMQQKEFQLHHENPQSFNPNKRMNATTEMETRTTVVNGQNVQSLEKPNRKEKLFYFPIKRDTLVEMLLSNLQEKFKSLRETRNINSSYTETSSKNGSVTEQRSEAIRLKSNTFKLDSPANISGYGNTDTPPKSNGLAVVQSKPETFSSSKNILKKNFEAKNETNTTTINASQPPKNPNYIFSPTNISGYGYTIKPPQQFESETSNLSKNMLKKYFEAQNETNTAPINASQAPKNPNSNFSAKQTNNSQPTETSIIEEYKPIPLK